MTLLAEVFCDGSCLGNPGPGGWAFLVMPNDSRPHELLETGAESHTTNNRMELTAACKAIATVGSCLLHTDSKYLSMGITQWISKWKKNGWRTSAKLSVKNIDLWQELDDLRSRYQVEWRWIKGHNQHPIHDRVDRCAREAAFLITSR